MPKRADNMDMDPVPVGKRLAEARTALDKTQKQFAERAGIGTTTYGNYETGERLIPPGAALAVCEAWGLTLDFIYKGEMGDVAYNLGKVIKAKRDLATNSPEPQTLEQQPPKKRRRKRGPR